MKNRNTELEENKVIAEAYHDSFLAYRDAYDAYFSASSLYEDAYNLYREAADLYIGTFTDIRQREYRLVREEFEQLKERRSGNE